MFGVLSVSLTAGDTRRLGKDPGMPVLKNYRPNGLSTIVQFTLAKPRAIRFFKTFDRVRGKRHNLSMRFLYLVFVMRLWLRASAPRESVKAKDVFYSNEQRMGGQSNRYTPCLESVLPLIRIHNERLTNGKCSNNTMLLLVLVIEDR